MTDRGDDDLFGPGPDGGDELWRPTRPAEPGGTGADVPPIAEQTDPAGPTPTSEPTRMMDPLGASGPEPTRVGSPVPPAGPFGPGGPYGGPGGGAGGGPGGPDDPDHPFAEDDAPVPWYRQPGPLAALIAGLVAIVLAVLALILMNDGDDEITTGSTSSTTSTTLAPTTLPVVLPPTVPPAPAPAETAAPATTTTSTTLAPTTTSTSTTTSSTSTTTTTTTTSTTTTTTTLPPTTTTAASTTTTSTTLPPVPPASPWVVIQDNPSLTLLEGYIEEAGLQSQFEAEDITVLAPDDVSFQQLSAQPGGAELLADEAMLTELLLRHVVVEPLTSAVIFTRSELETVAESGPVAVDVAGRRIEGAAITAANIEAGESYVQVIDRVLVGPLLEG